MRIFLLTLCLPALVGCACPAYFKVELASATGYVSEAKTYFAIVDDSLPDGKCAVATSMYDQRPQPYSDMFPHGASLAATQ